jgi:nicotinate-nucleotide adenylyltransferase
VAHGRRIAIFGGSFNPPHVAHQLVCTTVLSTASPPVDEIWMVPTWKHPFDKPLCGYAERVAMCELAARAFGGRVAVSRIEEELGGHSFTLRTVRALKARHPEIELALVIGADLLGERERWHGWAELKTLIPFIVVGRAGQTQGGEGDAANRLDLPAVSSTEVRARLESGAQVDALVDHAVLDYIRAHGLFRPGPAG